MAVKLLGRLWEGVKVYGSVGDADEHQSHFSRFNLYYRLEAFRETFTGQELASSSVLLKPSCFSRIPF
jgi:hypothetical protein